MPYFKCSSTAHFHLEKKIMKFKKQKIPMWLIASSLQSDLEIGWAYMKLSRGGGHLHFRLDIILVKGLSKHNLNMYFSGTKIDPKYMFLHAFSLICPSFPFQNLSIWPKTHPFYHFCTSKRCTRVHCLVLKNNPNYMIFFYEDDIQLQIQVAPPPRGNYIQVSLGTHH